MFRQFLKLSQRPNSFRTYSHVGYLTKCARFVSVNKYCKRSFSDNIHDIIHNNTHNIKHPSWILYDDQNEIKTDTKTDTNTGAKIDTKIEYNKAIITETKTNEVKNVTNSNIEYINFGPLFFPKHKLDDIRFIAKCSQSNMVELLFDNILHWYSNKEIHNSIANFSSQLPKIYQINHSSNFASCGPFIFNKNKMHELDYIFIDKGTFESHIKIGYTINSTRISHTFTYFTSDEIIQVKDWLESNVKGKN